MDDKNEAGSDLSASSAEQTLRKTIFSRREEQWSHVTYNLELTVLGKVKRGEVAEVKNSVFDIFPVHDGHLSDNPHRQAIYEFVAAVTLITRFAIEGGLDTETAYSMSDAYIKTADRTKKKEEVYALLPKAALDFTRKVRDVKKRSKPPFSHPILRCAEYIDSNLHYKISLDALAKAAGRNSAYLCVQFKAETGMSVTEYINKARIEEAKNLLLSGEASISSVANTVGFCSQSYFTKVFRELTGETPGSYRLTHFLVHGENS